VWDADAVRDDLRRLIADRFGGPDVVRVIDETGDLNKGTHTIGGGGSTAAPPGGSKTVRSGCSWATPAPMGTP
jgi:hypothetical protein